MTVLLLLLGWTIRAADRQTLTRPHANGRYSGYEVEHVCNLTDVDDKIIKRMARDNVSLQDLTNKYATVRAHPSSRWAGWVGTSPQWLFVDVERPSIRHIRTHTYNHVQVFFEDLRALNILPASRYPRATEHIDDIVGMIQELVQR